MKSSCIDNNNVMSNRPSDYQNLDRQALLELVNEKNKHIQDLERQVEDQKRLRLQDSSQVEEKAAKIKEWVTNKLKELENQNKQLRDQNKKQKETVETLTSRLASLSPISSPRRKDNTNTIISVAEKVRYIDSNVPSSPIETIDVNRSLKTRRPQLKKTAQQSISSTLDDDSQSLSITLNSYPCTPSKSNQNNHSSIDGDVSYVSVNLEKPLKRCLLQPRQESPLYDSVNIELANEAKFIRGPKTKLITNVEKSTDIVSVVENHYDQSNVGDLPPPPPLPPHQKDRWELQLYNLAEQTFSPLRQGSCIVGDFAHPNSFDSTLDNDTTGSRQSSNSLKQDIISIVRPSFTTIDGNQVVDNLMCPEQDSASKRESNDDIQSHQNQYQRNSNDQLASSTVNQSLYANNNSSNNNSQSHSIVEHFNGPLDSPNGKKQLSSQNIFDSPIRSRSGKDSILRTQSVRRNPAPERLYDFISADLVKRGYLVKYGALRNHNRWFVLRNFNLYAYKREAEEAANTTPTFNLKLEPTFQIVAANQTSDGFPFKICYHDKTLTLVADSIRTRDEWIKIITVSMNMSDIEPDTLTRQNSTYEGILSVTRHGHIKRCHAILVSHVLVFLKSPIDPTPLGYLSVKSSRIREITDSHDYDTEELDLLRLKGDNFQDCSLAIYPRFTLNPDPVYITLGSQQETDGWIYTLSIASGIDQSSGTQFERTLTNIMIENSVALRTNLSGFVHNHGGGGCLWREHPIMMYSSKPIALPLTSLPNETLKMEAIELFKSVLLFTQVPIEPIAIDYHVSLLQTCLGRIIKYTELRNEFFAQLIKQSTYIIHKCHTAKLSSSGSSGCSSINQRSSFDSLSPSSSECQFITDLQQLRIMTNDNRNTRYDFSSNLSQSNGRDNNDDSPPVEELKPPSRSELLQVMQILAVAVSLSLPRGRLRWWLIDHLRKFSNPDTPIGKYALFTLKSIDRASSNGARDNVPSRMEIMSILQRNPFDHSTPHSLPISFADGSCLVVGADGSTTVEEFMASMSKSINIRHSIMSDFYLFSDDPIDAKNLHILEPQRKILDVVGWWEQGFKQNNSGRYQNTRLIKLICMKRLLLKSEEGETDQERLFIVHQVNQEIAQNKIPLNKSLAFELGAIMTQLTFGDFERSKDPSKIKSISERVTKSFLPSRMDDGSVIKPSDLTSRVIDQWQNISGRSAQDCVRVYLNCIRRLKLDD